MKVGGMGLQRCLVFVYLVSSMMMRVSVSAADRKLLFVLCNDLSGNYTQNSTYQNNLNALLSPLSSNVNDYGFYNASAGQSPDKTSVVAMCRGDVELSECRKCLNDAAEMTVQSCPTQKEAFGGYYECMIRYCNNPIIGSISNNPVAYFWNSRNVTSMEQFNQDLWKFLDGLVNKAANNGSSFLKFAADKTTGPDSQPIYALVQCIPDLSAQECSACLNSSFQEIRIKCDNCYGKTGAALIGPSCNFRYESALFFEKESQKLCRDQIEESSSSVEISSVESLVKFELSILQNATENFSEANKIGEGGFGVVYKGKLENNQLVAVKRLSENSRQDKSDVYSFGVLVLEIISGQRNTIQSGNSRKDLLFEVWTEWEKGSTLNVIDRLLKVPSSPKEELKRCIHVALLCVQENAIDRPKMSEVHDMLNPTHSPNPYMNLQKRVAFLFLNLHFYARAVPQDDSIIQHVCGSGGNYTQNSTYQKNLNTILSSLSENVDEYGFYNASIGQDSDRVSAVVLCRGDVELNLCRGCVKDAARKIVQQCPDRKVAYGWYVKCLIYYSNETIIGSMSSDTLSLPCNNQNATQPAKFNQDLRSMLDRLLSQATQGGPFLKFAAGNTSAPDLNTIYALVQCTPDLSAQGCSDCLTAAFGALSAAQCVDRVGAIVLTRSCNFRYENYRFFNYTLIKPPPPLPQSAKEETSSLCEIKSVESLQYDLDTIRAATNNFSEANKLGQGGFGVVYKGQLADGIEIAVKRLSGNSQQGDLEFKNEVVLVARLHHRNLVWIQWQNWTASTVIDQMLRGVSSPVHEIMKCIHVGLLCVQDNVADRPTMGEIVLILSSSSLSLAVPSRPAFFVHNIITAGTVDNTEASRNEVSCTEFYPR
nr:putative receptor-like protein kinase At4g00960 [Ipomoea batatas]